MVHTTVQQLTKLEAIKTWSLVVTLLGDMSQPQLSGKQMGLLLGHVGLKPEAIRVAMHRLKKDGWITTSKHGREVLYSLSELGVDATQSVYSDVYRTDVKYPNGWSLYLVESDDAFEGHGPEIIRLLKRLYLLPNGHEAQSSSALHIAVQNNNIPSWLVERLIPVDVLTIAKQLNKLALDIINAEATDSLPSGAVTVDEAALRLLFCIVGEKWPCEKIRGRILVCFPKATWLSANGMLHSCWPNGLGSNLTGLPECSSCSRNIFPLVRGVIAVGVPQLSRNTRR